MINQTAEYALRAVVFLACHSNGPASRRAISDSTQVPSDYLTKVLQLLDKAGVVRAQRGPGGGYRLAIEAAKLSVYDVVNAVSSVPRIKSCPLGIAEHAQLCPLHRRLDSAAALVEAAFRATTIGELVPNRKSPTTCQFPQYGQSHK